MTTVRLKKWVKENVQACDGGEAELVAGLTNGDIDKPEWLCVSEINSDTVRVWDEENGSQYLGFIDLS